ncbi:MAG: hypothetical protein R2828_23440 [Saprospiraceae bacterium]
MKPFLYFLFPASMICIAIACQNNKETTVLFQARCGSCHLDNGQSLAPSLIHLSAMSPRSIVASLESGKMQHRQPGPGYR